MLTVPLLLTGSTLVIFGRKLYWFAVGLLGFLGGLFLTTRFFSDMPGTTRLLIALGLGVLGAVLTVTIQRVSLTVTGFLGGAYLGMGLLRLLQLDQGAYRWAVIIIIGLLGALLIFRVFNWGLILVSSLAGSMIIVLTLNLQNMLALVVFGGLCLAGLVVQGLIQRPKKA
ncbi:MAG: DUF4203 domain-containing protein [bacterium]